MVRAWASGLTIGALFAVEALLAMGTLSGCAASGTPEERDYLEPLNKAVFYTNGVVDQFTFRPAAALWTFFAPPLVQRGANNFWANLTYFDTIFNGAFQGKFHQAGSDLGRFLVNSTVGVLGLFDVAGGWGLEKHTEDLGKTLAHYGVGEGTYLVLPIGGPSTLRDAPGRLFTLATNPVMYLGSVETVLPAWFAWKVDERAQVDPYFEARARNAPDPYAFTRDAWLRHRDFFVGGGESRPEDYLEELEGYVQELEDLEALDELDALEDLEE